MNQFRRNFPLPVGLIGAATSIATLVWLSLTGATGDQRQLFRSAFPLDALRNVDPADAKVSAEILIRRIVEKQGYDYTAAVPKNHAEFLNGMLRNEYDFFLIFAADFLRYRDRYPMEPRVAGVRGGELPMERLILMTSAEAKVEDLEGGTLLVQNGAGELAMIWLEEEMAARGIANPTEFFGEIKPSRSVGESVVPVFFGKADACVVREEALATMVELNPQIGVRLARQIVSDPLLLSLLCVRPGYKEDPPGVIEEVSTALHKTPDGGQILTLMRIEKLVRFEENFLEGTEKLLRRRQSRLGTANSNHAESGDAGTPKEGG